MKDSTKIEIANAITHGIGVILGIIFLLLLVIPSAKEGNTLKVTAFSIYGACFITMFLSSTIYHSITNEKAKKILRVLDHSSIYLFIAGTYVPIILLVLEGPLRIILLVLISILALTGIFYKIFTYGKYDKYKRLSTILYIAMGWIAVFFIKPIINSTSPMFFFWILLGGLLYSGGTYFYKSDSKYAHVIWHLFVLAAAITQFIAIYFYLL
ncbi:PAQR family membrane homeostasis protein TrhA [Miniphocaeibacter halophilus]|uniref:Hemolysin III family protein n=1 Tax=Miniphocaeibacter halophilus TaxID=2931922 RepID=A0AC61MPI5_9FIRM|nr:hemolysin III family protein [Miniphocaeibacter halophilus]QQK07450.1 hemolysin III family protein [Miniphocaeibacter halophilus]